MTVRRKDGRVCLMLPTESKWADYHDVFPHGAPSAVEGRDDARNGMSWYEKGGAVATRCGQVALYDNQSQEDVTCMGCVAYL